MLYKGYTGDRKIERRGRMIDEAINELKKYTLGRKNTEKVEISVLQINRVIKTLEQQSKTGHWIKSTGYDDRDRFYTCSECGRHINLICGAKLADYPYCHCGTKMEEVEE